MRRRRSCPRRATMAGRTAWATSRPTATASRTARCAPPTRRLRQRRPRAGADQRLVRLQQPRQRLDQQHRPGHAAAHHGHRQGRGHRALQQRLVQPRQPQQLQRLPAVPARAGRQQRPQLRRDQPDAAVPVPDRLRRDGVHRPAVPLQGGRGQLRALAQVLGRPLVPNDFGNNSAKHALLLDPATDQDGSQPIYADSFRGSLPWGANYMDSKFGPDGALYVQVYEGFFTTGSGAGLYRFKYTGGATPRARTRSGSRRPRPPDPVLDRRLRRRLLRVGLRRRPDVRGHQPDPHLRAAGSYTAKLTVTYADGEKATQT